MPHRELVINNFVNSTNISWAITKLQALCRPTKRSKQGTFLREGRACQEILTVRREPEEREETPPPDVEPSGCQSQARLSPQAAALGGCVCSWGEL